MFCKSTTIHGVKKLDYTGTPVKFCPGREPAWKPGLTEYDFSIRGETHILVRIIGSKGDLQE